MHAESIEEPEGELRERLEAVAERPGIGRVARSEPQVIGRDEVVLVREEEVVAESSRTGAVVDVDGDRAALVAAASDLFSAHGIQAVGMDTVRAEAGVPLKRVYRAFRSKDELVEATLRARDADLAGSIRRFLAARTQDSPAGRLLAVFDWMHDRFAEEAFRGCAFVNAFGELGDDAAHVAEPVRDHKRAFRALIRELVGELGLGDSESESLAERVYILANGAMVTAPVTGSPATALEAKEVARVLVEAATAAPTDGRHG